MNVINNTLSSFIKKFLGFSIGPVVSAFLGLIIVPITTYFVSPEEFGKSSMYTLGYTLFSLIIYLGMDQAFVREYNAVEDKKKLFWSSFTIPFIFSLLFSATILIFYKPISMALFDSHEWYIMLLLSISMPFAVMDNFNMLILRMQEKAVLFSMMSVINKVVNLFVLLGYFFFIEKSFKAIINATFLSLVIMVISEIIINREYWSSKIHFDKVLIKRMFRFALPLIPATIISWIFGSMDRMALKEWSTFYEIGLFAAALKISNVLGIFQQAFATFWVPTAYRWYEEGESRDKFIKVSDYLTIAMTFLFICMLIFKKILMMLLASSYGNASSSLTYLLFMPVLYTMSETTAIGITFKRRTGFNLFISIFVAIINFILNFILVPKLGSLGAAISSAVAYITFFWLRTIFSSLVWGKFDYKVYIANTSIMIAASIVDVVFNNPFLNAAFIIIFIILNMSHVKEVYSLAANFLGSKFGKGNKERA